jgi:hypothetical protein
VAAVLNLILPQEDPVHDDDPEEDQVHAVEVVDVEAQQGDPAKEKHSHAE